MLAVVALSCCTLLSFGAFAARKAIEKHTVVYETSMDCEHCVKKITENVSFEKGVKDLSTNLADRSVTVVFEAAKTDTLKLGNAIRKLGYTAKVVKYE